MNTYVEAEANFDTSICSGVREPCNNRKELTIDGGANVDDITAVVELAWRKCGGRFVVVASIGAWKLGCSNGWDEEHRKRRDNECGCKTHWTSKTRRKSE